MGIEALRQQLKEGKITKEQFAAEAKKLLDAGTITQEVYDAAIKEDGGDPPGGSGGSGGSFSAEQMAEIQKMIQAASDQVRSTYSFEKKKLEDELEKIKKEKMTEEQKAEYERQKLERDLKDREAALTKREVELHTIDKLTEAKLPLAFKPFLAAGSKEDTEKNIEAFAAAWQTELKAAVDETFKKHGGDPGQRKQGGGGSKGWKEMTLTEQGQLYREDKAKAIQLAAAAGIKLN